MMLIDEIAGKYSAKMHGEAQDWMMLIFLLAAVLFAAELGSSDGPGNEKHPQAIVTGNPNAFHDVMSRARRPGVNHLPTVLVP